MHRISVQICVINSRRIARVASVRCAAQVSYTKNRKPEMFKLNFTTRGSLWVCACVCGCVIVWECIQSNLAHTWCASQVNQSSTLSCHLPLQQGAARHACDLQRNVAAKSRPEILQIFLYKYLDYKTKLSSFFFFLFQTYAQEFCDNFTSNLNLNWNFKF